LSAAVCVVEWKILLTVGTAASESVTSERTTLPTFATDVTTGTSSALLFLFRIVATKYETIRRTYLPLYGFTAYVGFAVMVIIDGFWHEVGTSLYVTVLE